MATAKSEGKSAFLKEFFVDHPDAKGGEINEAWRAAGKQSKISSSLISMVRSNLGLKGKGRPRPGVTESAGSSGQAPSVTGTRRGGRGPEKSGGHTPANPNGWLVTEGREQPGAPREAGDDRIRLLIRLEDQIDGMIHEIKATGGLPEFEEALRRARRILVRSYEE
jgi:hypothetical protein